MKNKVFKGKTALITGGSSGIGRELSFLFADAGAEVILVARNIERLKETQSIINKKWNVPCRIMPTDLASSEDIKNFINVFEKEKLTVDILVNNAGFMTYGFFHKLDLEVELAEIEVNAVTPVYLTHFFLKSMLEKRQGWILNIASTAALLPCCPFEAVYGASKSFLYSFSLALSQEYKDRNIHISCLLPGNTDTEFWSFGNLARKYSSKRKFMAPSQEVAKLGFDILISRKPYAVFETKTRFQAFLLRFLPISLINSMVRKRHYESFFGRINKNE